MEGSIYMIGLFLYNLSTKIFVWFIEGFAWLVAIITQPKVMWKNKYIPSPGSIIVWIIIILLIIGLL